MAWEQWQKQMKLFGWFMKTSFHGLWNRDSMIIHFGGLPFFSLKEGPARLEALLSTGWRIFFSQKKIMGAVRKWVWVLGCFWLSCCWPLVGLLKFSCLPPGRSKSRSGTGMMIACWEDYKPFVSSFLWWWWKNLDPKFSKKGKEQTQKSNELIAKMTIFASPDASGPISK